MKFNVKGPFRENIYSLMRKLGYFFQRKNEQDSEFSFARPASGYPRFHIYLKEENEDLIFNLHLDQKKPSYKGVAAHSGEYDSDIVLEETERIKQALKNL